MTTEEKLVAAAAALLDCGGEEAVTLRAVAQAVGVSHNAPYKHFRNRDALLGAVATADFVALRADLQKVGRSSAKPTTKLTRALKVVTEYSVRHPARYQLLFNDPKIAAQEGGLKQAALGTFGEFDAIVQECQATGGLPSVPRATLTGLVVATLHGLVSLEASGRMKPEKGLTGVTPGLELLVRLLTSANKSSS